MNLFWFVRIFYSGLFDAIYGHSMPLLNFLSFDLDFLKLGNLKKFRSYISC